jgi:hypothetical protein
MRVPPSPELSFSWTGIPTALPGAVEAPSSPATGTSSTALTVTWTVASEASPSRSVTL